MPAPRESPVVRALEQRLAQMSGCGIGMLLGAPLMAEARSPLSATALAEPVAGFAQGFGTSKHTLRSAWCGTSGRRGDCF